MRPVLKPRPQGKVGRPSKWKDSFVREAYNLALLGATDEMMARAFEVAVETIYLWKSSKPQFYQAIHEGKDKADATIARSVFKRAKGFEKKTWKEVVTKDGEIIRVEQLDYIPPDGGLGLKWLASRQRGLWSAPEAGDGAQAQGPLVNLTLNVDPVQAANIYQKLIKS